MEKNNKTYSTSYEYDAVNRLTKLTNSDSIFSYTYDGNNNLVCVIDNKKGNIDLRISYNKANLPTKYISKIGGQTNTYTMSYYTNGLKYLEQDTLNGMLKYFTYNSLGQLINEGETRNSSMLYNTDYAYDKSGNRTQMTERNYDTNTKDITNYTYDANNRLTDTSTMGNLTFSAANGSMTKTSQYSYDFNGNMLTETEDNTTKSYQYDEFNRLTGFTDGTKTAQYTYGADNFRASKTVNGVKTTFAWNGQNLANETANNVTTVYSYDPTGIITSKTGNNPLVRFVKDPHGNVVTTSENNSVFGTYIYTAFGNQIESTDTENPFRYCGEYYDSETGLTYLRNRYYNSATGRFLNEDPIKDGLNWYVYCNNNPVMNVDPSGLERLDEDDINELRKKQQVVISEQEETIDIYLSLNFVYNMNFANIIAQSKEFEKAKNTVIEGMKNYWSGTFEYKRINIIIDDVTGDSMNEYKTIDVMIDLNNDNRSYTYIYNNKEQRKINNDRFYIKGIELNLKNMNSNQIKATAGHELGHVFGIDDFYSIPDFFGIHSIMQNNDLGQTAYSLEFNLMFQSYIQNRFLFFNKSTYTPNSIVEKNRKMVKSFVK